MKELTRIPNARNAILYRDTLIKALEIANIDCQTVIEEHYTDQYSEVVVSVPDSELEKANTVLKAIIKRGPPTT